MNKFIDAEKLKAEIERLQKHSHVMGDNAINSNMRNFYEGQEDCCKQLISLIASLQQEQHEVDLKKQVDITTEIEEHAGNMPHCEFSRYTEDEEDEEWAKKEFRYFYELGLNARKQ